MRRAVTRSRTSPAAEAATRTKPGRNLAMVAGLAVLIVFLGALVGAHLALSSRQNEVAAAAHLSLPMKARQAGLAAAPSAPSATPAAKGRIAGEDDARDVALARLYEEAPEPVPGLDEAPANQATALPAPAEMPRLVPARRPPVWLRNAVRVAVEPGQAMIAIVIDDLGLRRAATYRAIALPAPLTLSFLTYAKGLPGLAAAAHERGHELLLHVPMQPKDPRYDPGPRVLRVGMSQAEITKHLVWGLNRFQGFVGINNHMGSRFTSAPAGMAQVMRELRRRDLLFLDSLTSATSVAWRAAARAGVPFARRDIFLDHASRDPAAIRGQLEALERIARKRGYAVGIGHPHTATLKALAAWLPEARRRGFALVPISAIVNHQIEIAQRPGGTAG